MKNAINLFIALVLAMQLPAKTIEKTYFFNDFQTQQVGDYQMIIAPGALQTAISGQPLLPWFASKVLLPPGEEIVSVEIIANDQIDIAGSFQLLPKQYAQPVSKGASGIFVKDQKLYKSNDVYPISKETFQTSFWGGHSIGIINYTPFEYIPATGALSYYRQMTLVIETAKTDKAQAALSLMSSTSNAQVRQFVENPELISEYNYPATKDDSYDYLIITPNQFVADFDTLVAHYLQRGMKTLVKSKEEILEEMEGQDAPEKIRNYIIQEYTEKGVTYTMLGGDVEHIPYRGFYCQVQSSSVYEDSNIPSDLYFSALDGNWNDDGDGKWGEIGEDDLLPEMAVARFSFSNASELEKMLHKTISYQSFPVEGNLDHPLLAGEHLYDYPQTWGNDYLELLIGYHDDNGYETTGIPESNTFTKLYDENSTWSANTLMNEINSGKNFVHHVGHANENTVMKLYTSDITNANFSGANGVDHQFTNVYTHGCICGSFDANDCIAEHMVKIDNFAAAFIGNSRYGWFNEGQTEGPSAHIHREFVDALYTDGLHRIGMAHMESKYATSPWVNAPGQHEEGALRWCFYDCNVLGDPAMSIWTDLDQQIYVSYDPVITIGQDTYHVEVTTASGDSPYLLTAALYMDGVLHGTGNFDATGVLDFDIDPVFTNIGTATLAVTGQNSIPQEFEIQIIPSAGAYVILDECDIDDSGENNNGMLDYGESVLLNVSLENVGEDLAEGVTAVLSCDHEDITINSSTFTFGDISGNSSVSQNAAFGISVSNSIENLSQITFEMEITSGDDTWISHFSLMALAPELALISFDLDDSEGNNNGRLDPGENVQFSVEMINEGNSASPDLSALLSTTSDFISISNPQQYNPALDVDETSIHTYELLVSEDCQSGDVAHLIMNLTGGAYGDYMSYYLPVGLLVEDWESGGFEQFEWFGGGNAAWNITTNNPYEGEYCLQSGLIGDNQTSSMNIELNVLSADSISFYYKVSSETDFDFLRFNIDGNEMDKWSGEVGWTRKAYPIYPGEHSFSWIYTKDMIVSSGDDKGYVDYIVFPAMGLISQTNEAAMDLDMAFYPNPAQDWAQLKFHSDQDQFIHIQIIDQQGRTVYNLNENVSSGNQQIDLSVKALEAGVYNIVISGKEGIQYFSFIKM